MNRDFVDDKMFIAVDSYPNSHHAKWDIQLCYGTTNQVEQFKNVQKDIFQWINNTIKTKIANANQEILQRYA